jgi:hypothetical protein
MADGSGRARRGAGDEFECRNRSNESGRTAQRPSKLDLLAVAEFVLEIDQSGAYADPDSNDQEVPMNSQIAIFLATEHAAELMREANRNRLANSARGSATRPSVGLRWPSVLARLSFGRAAVASR